MEVFRKLTEDEFKKKIKRKRKRVEDKGE